MKMFIKAYQFVRLHKNTFFFFVLLFGVYWINTLHTNFSDEFDNIVGGWYINQGRLPYTGFFSHHNPGAYYIASLLTIFTKSSFVAFRVGWAIILFASALGTYVLLKRRLPTINLNFHLVFLLLFGLFATYSWAHMILSETIVAYALIPAYALVLLKSLHRIRITLLDIGIISFTSAIALFTSFTFIFSIAILWLFVIYYFIKTNGFSSKLLKVLLIVIIPYCFFIAYLFVTGSVKEFYFQSLLYNRDYYIYNFPKVAGQISKHPVRYAISIFYTTSIQFHSLLVQSRNFNFSYPVTITLLLGNFGLMVYFLTRKQYLLALFLYTFLVYLNARAEPLNAAETDFHSTVYFAISWYNLVLLLTELYKSISKTITSNVRFVYQVLLVVVGVYFVFATLFITRAFSEKAYDKFMGNAPAIYDAPVVAPIINKIVSPNDYFWIGPFEFQELLYINGKLPSKYHWFLPAHARSDKIKEEFTKNLLEHKPKLIVFKDYIQMFGVKPEEFNYPVVNILQEHYFRIRDLEKEGRRYKILITDLHNFDIATDFYFSIERKEEIISQLVSLNIIIEEL